jgi:hypothetical protein
MADPHIPTQEVVEMRDTLHYPPQAGNRYLCVSMGNTLAIVEWKKGDEEFWVCAMPYPKVPPESKERIMAQYELQPEL